MFIYIYFMLFIIVVLYCSVPNLEFRVLRILIEMSTYPSVDRLELHAPTTRGY